MHLPDSMLGGTICPVTLGAGAAAFAVSAFLAFRDKNKNDSYRFCLITALIFALQMLNYPIGKGVSGHFIGAALAVFALGPVNGLFSMGIVILIQALVFGDGGVLAFGANFINMAVVPGLFAFFALKLFESDDFSEVNYPAYALISYISVVAASFVCALVILPVSGEGAVLTSKTMIFVHAKIALGESFLTSVLMWRIKTSKKINKEMLFLISAALLISPFASSFPDGLEYSAERLLEIKTGFESLISGLMPDYSISVIDSVYFSTFFAGLTGVLITIAVSGVIRIKNFK